MRNQYNILLGLALLIAIGVGYGFNKNRYFYTKTGDELTKTVYEGLENKDDTAVETIYNFQAGVTAGLTTLGIGLIILGFTSRKKTYKI